MASKSSGKRTWETFHLDVYGSRKETVLDLAKFVDRGVQVKLTGGRQVTGTLKGYDQLLNLVLDEAVEFLRDADDPLKTTDQTRRLGLIVCRGTAVKLVPLLMGLTRLQTHFSSQRELRRFRAFPLKSYFVHWPTPLIDFPLSEK